MGDGIDAVAEVVEEDDGQGGACDTEGRVDEGLGDTSGECRGIGGAGGGQRTEGLDHPQYGTDKTDEGTDAGAGGKDHHVLAEHGQFEGRGLFEFLFHALQAGLLVVRCIVEHGLVPLQSASHHVGHGALLLIAHHNGLVHIVVHQVLTHVHDELIDAALPFGAAKGDEALHREDQYDQVDADQDGYDEPALVNSAVQLSGVHIHRVPMHRVTVLEVVRRAEHEHVKGHADDQHQGEHDGHEQGVRFPALHVAHWGLLKVRVLLLS